jgi:hypothetical protein
MLATRALDMSDAISRYQWMRACAAGYFLSAMASGFVIPYSGQALIPFDSMLHGPD